MSVRTKILALLDTLMRIPPLFLIDEILKNYNNNFQLVWNLEENSNFTEIIDHNYTEDTISHQSLQEQEEINTTTRLNLYIFLVIIFKSLLCLLGCASALFSFFLWTRHLVIVYMYIISIGLIFLSYWSNVSAINLIKDGPSLLEDILSLNLTKIVDPSGLAVALLPHFLLQWLMGTIYAYIHLGPKYQITQRALPFSFLMPLFLAVLPIPTSIIQHSPAFSAILPLVLSKIALWSSSLDIIRTVVSGYQHAVNFAGNFGLSALVENEWQRLNVPCVLRTFWMIRLFEQFLTLTISANEPLTFAMTVQKLLINGCETLIALLGMTSIISIICHYIGKLFQLFLMSDDDEDKSIGTVSAILFYILSLQTGLTSLQPDKRFIRLCRNFCLLVTALLHFLHNMVAPILMSLSASHNPSRKRHTRALTVCAFLLIAPIILLSVLWSRHSPSTWLLAVTVFSVEVVVKVCVSLATYTLFLLDARRQTFWEKLDDYVYYIKAFGNSVEFCFGIFLFFNGAWILVFESDKNFVGGAIRALMMCVHAYFNIWCEARAGWVVFMKRRTAVHKISSLPEATSSQLRQFDDVCAICYQEMTTSARITRCNHYFHGVCLRKWLYVQDKCPLCHEVVINQENKQIENPNQDNHENELDMMDLHNQNLNNPGNQTNSRQSTPNRNIPLNFGGTSSNRFSRSTDDNNTISANTNNPTNTNNNSNNTLSSGLLANN